MARRDVDHAVIRRHEDPGLRAETTRQAPKRTVHALQGRDPWIRLPALVVAGHVEFGEVRVSDPTPAPVHERITERVDSVVDRLARDISRASEHGIREAAVPVSIRPERKRLEASRIGPLEERRRALPPLWKQSVVPAAKLIHDLLAIRNEPRVSDDPVLARLHTGRQARNRCRSRRRNPGRENVGTRRHGTRERPRVAGSRPQVLGAEPVDEHDCGAIHPAETQSRGLPLNGCEAIPEHVGKARSTVGGPG